MAVHYRISGDRMTALADQARRLGKVTGELTPAQIEETLSGVTIGGSGGGSMFASSAAGILPTVYKGMASSAFTLNFESSAVGALSE